MIDTGMVDGKTVEILPYYKNGSLQGKRLSYQELRETVIPCINEALRELHKIGVVHKDLKPSNIMRLDNGRDVAIIDFGISSVIDDGRTVLVTKTGMTPEYSAPETFRSVFLEESDYYSLGITLYELFCGRTPYAGMSNDEITQYMSIQKIPFPDEMPKALKELIAGLTYSDLANRNDKKNPNRRWTYEEVCNWCSGKYQPIPGEANIESNTARIPAYKFRGELYTDTTELVQALASDWGNGKKQLYRGLLTGFFMACDPEIAEACMDAEDSVTKRGENEDVAFWKLLYKMSPDVNTFFWKNQKYESLNVFGTDLMEKLRSGNVNECPALEKLQDEEHLKNFAAITVMPLLADCQKEIVTYERIFEVYSQTKACYEALCLSAEVEPKETRCCQAGLEMLQKEIERLQQQLAEDDERAYISQSIDEVMAEMGYDVIGQRQVHKKNGRHFTNELYAYEDGTAVNVTYADDGKITMELGGLDTDDRLPDAAEAKQLCESMESFCDDFSEIEKRLEAKGVVLKSRMALLPPSEDYAQIINVSDYQTTAPIDTFKANNRRSGIGQGKERYLKE